MVDKNIPKFINKIRNGIVMSEKNNIIIIIIAGFDAVFEFIFVKGVQIAPEYDIFYGIRKVLCKNHRRFWCSWRGTAPNEKRFWEEFLAMFGYQMRIIDSSEI